MNQQPLQAPQQPQQARYASTRGGRGRGNGGFRQYINQGQQVYGQKSINGQGSYRYPQQNRISFPNGNPNAHIPQTPGVPMANPNQMQFPVAQTPTFEENGGLLPSPQIQLENQIPNRNVWQPQMAGGIMLPNANGLQSQGEPNILDVGSETGSNLAFSQQQMQFPPLSACGYYPVTIPPGHNPGYYMSPNQCYQPMQPNYGFAPPSPFLANGFAGPTYAPNGQFYGHMFPQLLCINCRNPQVEQVDNSTMTESNLAE